MNTTVLTVGNALIDLFLNIHADSKESVEISSGRISFPLGKKILMDTSEYRIGGNACNVAVGLSRLGITTAIMAEIANDEFSEKIVHDLEKEKVSTEYLLRSTGQTSITIAINADKDRTLFTTHKTREHNFSLEAPVSEWVYLTSLGKEWRHVYERISAQAAENKIKLAFNPGSVQFAEGAESFADVLENTDVLFLNKEEAKKIVGDYKIEELLELLEEKIRGICVITDGENGAYAIEKGTVSKIDTKQTEVVERTGAGDAFASGFLGAHVQGKDVSESMKWGIENSVSVIGKVGSQAGLLTKEEINK